MKINVNKEVILRFLRRYWGQFLSVAIWLYVLINPDRLGTWVGRFFLNIKLIMGEL